MAEQMQEEINPPYTVFGVLSARGQIVGAVLFNGLHEGNVEISAYAPGRISRGVLRVAASYAFGTAGCNRVTARTRVSNLRVRRFLEKVGFHREGVLSSYYRDGDDAILYGLLKGECRW